jgi:hypothetical protein
VSPKWGLHRVIDVMVVPWEGGANVQLHFRAAPTDEGLVVGTVGAVVFFPAAVAGAAISWDKYESDWQDTRARIWWGFTQLPDARPVTNYAVAPQPQAPLGPQAQPAQPRPQGPVCPACHTALPPGARFCFSCGLSISPVSPQA